MMRASNPYFIDENIGPKHSLGNVNVRAGTGIWIETRSMGICFSFLYQKGRVFG